MKPRLKLHTDGTFTVLHSGNREVMHPETIKAALRIKGVSLASLGAELGVSRSMVSHVVSGFAKSARVSERIAAIIGVPVDAIWERRPSLRRVKTGLLQETSR